VAQIPGCCRANTFIRLRSNYGIFVAESDGLREFFRVSVTTALIVVIVVVVVVVVVVAAALIVRRTRRRAALRAQFGTEYDRTVQAGGSRREAERELDAPSGH
jgi:ABC-type sugar transport system permease subunit